MTNKYSLHESFTKWTTIETEQLDRITHFAITFQFIPKPFKITVTSAHTRLLHFENGQIRLLKHNENKKNDYNSINLCIENGERFLVEKFINNTMDNNESYCWMGLFLVLLI